jgi:hypothetical protein
MRHCLSTRAAIALLVVAAAACGHGTTPTSPSVPTASGTPQISSVAPAALTQNNAPQLLTVLGRNFSSSLQLAVTLPDQSQLVLAGTDIQAPQATSFEAVLPLLLAGTYQMTVTNGDGTTSAPFKVTVAADPSRSAPVISTLTPAQAQHGVDPQVVTIGGVNFTAGVTLSVTSPANVVTMVGGASVRDMSSTSIEASVVLASPGSYALAVVDATGRTSNTVTIVVK